MDLGIDGRSALVTGASAGLGLASAQALAAEGVRVVMVSRTKERIEAAAASVPNAVPLVADITDPAAVGVLLDEADEVLGGVDILIANGGGPPPGTFASTDLDAYQGALELNLLPFIAMSKRLIPPMQERGWGRVVAITSIAVREPIDVLILSNTARAGLTGFLKTTATEVASDGVTVNSVQPGLHLTDRLRGVDFDPEAAAKGVPANEIGDPDDFGKVVTFVCSDAAKYITGASIPVDGGLAKGLQ